MNKKWLAVIMAAVMAFGMAACAGSNSTDSGSSDGTGSNLEEGDTEGTSEEDAAAENEESGGAAESTDELTPLRIFTTGLNSDGSANLVGTAFIAYENGYLEDELNAIGYTAEYTGMASAGVGMNEALSADEADIVLYGDFPAATYIAANGDLSIFANLTTRQQMGIIAADGIGSVADLAGKTVGCMLGTVAYKYLLDELDKAGLSADDVEIVNASSDIMSLFLAGDIDAAAYDLTYLYYILAQGEGTIITRNGDDADLAVNMVVAGKSALLEEHPEIASAFISAYSKAQEYAAANVNKVYEMFADKSDNFTAEMYADYYSFDESFRYWDPEITDEMVESWQETADFMYENGYISEEINISDYVLR